MIYVVMAFIVYQLSAIPLLSDSESLCSSVRLQYPGELTCSICPEPLSVVTPLRRRSLPPAASPLLPYDVLYCFTVEATDCLCSTSRSQQPANDSVFLCYRCSGTQPVGAPSPFLFTATLLDVPADGRRASPGTAHSGACPVNTRY